MISIQALACSPAWGQIKTKLTTTIGVGESEVRVQLVRVRSPLGGGVELVRLVCPICSARRTALHAREAPGPQLGCRACLRVRHPDQQLAGPGSWDRVVVLPSRQIARITERLQHPMAWNERRRLLRRRARLLRQIDVALAARQERALAKVKVV